MTRAADVALSVARGARCESLAVGASIRVASHNPGRKGDHSAILKSRQRAAHRCLNLRCWLRLEGRVQSSEDPSPNIRQLRLLVLSVLLKEGVSNLFPHPDPKS